MSLADRRIAAEIAGMYESMSTRQKILDGHILIHPLLDLMREHRLAAEAEQPSEISRLRIENSLLRQHIADTANKLNVVGGHYDTAVKELKLMVSLIKRDARIVLTTSAIGDNK